MYRSGNDVVGIRNFVMTARDVEQAVHRTNSFFREVKDLEHVESVDLLKCMGLKNLSGAIGECFTRILTKIVPDICANPHPDGYPDILVLDEVGRGHHDSETERVQKTQYSPFPTGGFEVKATCGDKGPRGSTLFYERRNSTRLTWKAHHRQTNYLLGLHWDFIENYPTIVAVYYADDLVTEDWGPVVTPKENGSRTTSVSTMRSSGIRKMRKCTVVQLVTEHPA